MNWVRTYRTDRGSQGNVWSEVLSNSPTFQRVYAKLQSNACPTRYFYEDFTTNNSIIHAGKDDINSNR